MNKGVLVGLVILVAAAIGFGGWYAYTNGEIGAPQATSTPATATAATSTPATSTPAEAATPADASATDGPVPVVAADEMYLGKADAPVTIVEYFSLGCPHCKHFHEDILPQLKAEYIDTGKARIVFRDFPLDGIALAAAQLTRCVPTMAYFAMVDAMFQQQNTWHVQEGIPLLGNIAKGAGMDQATIDACIANKELRDKIVAGTKEGADTFKVEATPTFLINGTRVSGVGEYEPFKKAVEAALAPK